MALRYFSPIPLKFGQSAKLEGPDASHLIKAMRTQVGDKILLFDGSGFEFTGEVQETGRNHLTVAIVDQVEANTELSSSLAVACAIPKGDRSRFLVEKLTELGVDHLIPIEFQHSEKHAAKSGLKKAERWIIEASKQCGRTKLLKIQPIEKWNNFFQQIEKYPSRFIALAPSDLESIAEARKSNDGSVDTKAMVEADNLLLIGPEGGFTQDEVGQAMERDFEPIHIGKAVLRIETAAIAASSIIISRECSAT